MSNFFPPTRVVQLCPDPGEGSPAKEAVEIRREGEDRAEVGVGESERERGGCRAGEKTIPFSDTFTGIRRRAHPPTHVD
jgi:hypothetical protein